jgi:hypothetical protein
MKGVAGGAGCRSEKSAENLAEGQNLRRFSVTAALRTKWS